MKCDEIITKERPIIFSGPMVRAILDGRKTQTRRIMRPQPIEVGDEIKFQWATFYGESHVHTWDENGDGGQNWNVGDYPQEDRFAEALKRTPHKNPCPYGAPGDRLWVRESWAAGACSEGLKPLELYPGFHLRDNGGLWYRADNAAPPSPITDRGKWRQSIHMPRWASRITLEVTDVRVERLQDISNEDAVAEGARIPVGEYGGQATFSDRKAFCNIWNSIKGPDAWDKNPWVWAISFKVV